MKLTVVGCSGSYPGPDSPASCYVLEAEHEGRTWRVLLDMGSGALGQLHNHVDPLAVDAVLVTHSHADHCLDLCGYYVMRKYHPSGAAPRIPVFGPDDLANRMARAYDLPEDPGMTEEFDFITFEAPFSLGPFQIEPFPVVHPVDAWALRITERVEGGRTLVYSGDTGPGPLIEAAAVDADLFLVEASFEETADNPPELHLTGKECGEIAAKVGVRRMLLTHVPPWHDRAVALAEARAAWDGDVSLALPGSVHQV